MPVLVGAPFAPTQGLHFRAPHPLSFLFICTLHSCKHCTGKNVAPNFHKFALSAQCEIAKDAVVCMPVLFGAPFAPTLGLHFRAPHPLSFLFICTLHSSKHCTGKNVAPNFHKFALTALCEIAKDAVVCMPVLVGAPFAPTLGLHFRAPHSLSFLFICTLHSCKHCTGRNVAPNFRKFPLTALCEIAKDGIVWMPVLVGAPFAPTQGLHFRAPHPLSFLFFFFFFFYI